MAIAFDNNKAITAGTSPSSSVSYTTTGSNLYLVVGILADGGGTVGTAPTYNSVSMSQLTTVTDPDGNVEYIYGLAAPASGANTLQVFCSSAFHYVVASYTGAQQTTAAEASNTATGTSTTATVSVTTITNNAWLVGMSRTANAITNGSNTTFRGLTGDTQNIIDTNAAQTPAGSKSMTVTQTSGRWAMQAFSLKPFVASTSTGFFMAMVH